MCECASPYTTHFCFRTICTLFPKSWHLKKCWIEDVIINSSTLKTMAVFWYISPPEISASACFGFILIKGKFLPVLFYFILSASARVIFLKSSSSLKSSNVLSLDNPLKTKIFSFFASAKWYDLGNDNLTFFSKTKLAATLLALQDGKTLGVSPTKIQPFFVCLICKTLRLGLYYLSSLMILIGVLNFGSMPVIYECSLMFII